MTEKKDLSAIIDGIGSIPTLPSVVERITRLLQNPQTTAEEVGKAITVDQSLASKVLKLVNSAFYGFPGRISTITHAIVILGFSTVKNIVLTASIFDFFKNSNKNSTFDLEAFWRHSIACGSASQAVAKAVGYSEKESCFIGGLIHDIGKIILCNYFPGELSKIMQEVRLSECLFLDAEKKLFDFTHQDIGAVLAGRWNLPENLQQVIQHHHNPASASGSTRFPMIASVHCADVLVRAMDFGNGGDDKIPVVSDPVWQELGMENIAMSNLLDNVEMEYEKAAVFMQLV